MTTTPHTRFAAGLAAALVGTALVLPVTSSSAAAAIAPAKAGKACKKVGTTSSGLVCTKKAGKLVWAKAPAAASPAAPTPAAAPAPTPATPTPAAPSPANPAPAAAAAAGVEGTWKATSESVVGYRVKEILGGQPTEGVGRTNAVTGTMTIAGNVATAVDLTADLRKLESDSGRRDDQVQGRILETAKFPTATIKLKAPIDFGSVPAERTEISKSGTVSLTLHGVTKDLPVDVKASRNGEKIAVGGSIKITFSDFGITNPSLPPFVTTDPDGLLEFVIVFGR